MHTTSHDIAPIAIGSDHAGLGLKTEVAEALKAEGYVVEDFGAFFADVIDYPDIAREVAEAVAQGRFVRAILVCGTGIGMSIAANKIHGVRAAACSEPYSAIMSRQHNNANTLCIGARVVGIGLAMEICRAFLETGFEAGTRHELRVGKIMELEHL